jgi:hypothetical protein
LTKSYDNRKAIRSLRKLPKFGISDKGAEYFDFEWPKKDQLLQMPEDETPVKVVAIEWQESSKFPNFIGAIQLELSNGYKSPLIKCDKVATKAMQRVELTFPIKRIIGTDCKNYVS